MIYALRVWLTDRPGALGTVAGTIGSVGGDLVGIDILERGGGRAIDELIVSLQSDTDLDQLLAGLSKLEGVDVEDVRVAGDGVADPRLDALETAAALVTKNAVGPLLSSLATSSRRDFQSDWATVVDPDAAELRSSVGTVPPGAWLKAFLAGSRASVAPRPGDGGPDDVAWADLDVAVLVLVVGRQGRPFRLRERRQLSALARIADARWAELTARAPRRSWQLSGPT